MYRIDNATSTDTLPAPSAAGPNPDGYFTGGNPGGGVPATIVDDEWLNAVQEEIANVIEDADGGDTALSKASRTQLKEAIAAMIVARQQAVIVEDATFEASVTDGEVVYWDAGNTRFDEAIADGSAAQQAVGIADVTNSRVVAFGQTPAGIVSGLTPGAKYYLSGSAAGALTTSAPANVVVVGIAKSATVLLVDIDQDAGGSDAYDWPFNAGYTAIMTGLDLVDEQTYGEAVVARAFTAAGESGYIGTAGTGAAVIVDVLKNGTSIYTTKPEFADGANTLTAGTLKSDGTEIFAAGDRLTFKVTQVGSTVPGQALRFTLKGTAG